MTGWGVTYKVNRSEGFWDNEEITRINVLELKAIFYGNKSYSKNQVFKHVKVMCDNTTTISYFNHMGGQKFEDCNSLKKEVCKWCIERNLWISAAHIPDCNNLEADLYSRELEDAIEWQLNPAVFKNIINTFGTPGLDLFASRINKQLPEFVSWHSEPEAWVIDVFSLL